VESPTTADPQTQHCEPTTAMQYQVQDLPEGNPIPCTLAPSLDIGPSTAATPAPPSIVPTSEGECAHAEEYPSQLLLRSMSSPLSHHTGVGEQQDMVFSGPHFSELHQFAMNDPSDMEVWANGTRYSPADKPIQWQVLTGGTQALGI